MSNVNSEEQSDHLYEKTLDQVKKVYKPRLKNLSKNKLIDMIVEMSTHIAALKQQNDNNVQQQSNQNTKRSE